jgi:eukaryotic-like serine/threonine-protein kinase
MNDLPDDAESLQLLDDYLARLQAGGQPSREELLQRRPDLAAALHCLEALEGLASAATGASGLQDVLGDDDAACEPLPRLFGEYELLSEIGRGGMGVVYKARQTSLERVVAIKMILHSQMASPEHVRRFHLEARAAARLRHANIVHIHEVGQLHGQHYFAMEYIEGESLAQRLAHGPIDLPAVVHLVATVARAVDHLHRQNVVHRDLKPSNILLDAAEQPYVTDFGLAKLFEPGSETTAVGLIAGTPSYMAPEQAAGEGRPLGPAADVYSLGAILYELLTGQPPFRAETPLDTLRDVLGREPTPPRWLKSHVPVGLELICLKCLAKSPEERYASAAALADDLERFARGEALEVRPPHFGQQIWRWQRRQPALAMRLAAMGVLYSVEWVNCLVGAIGITWDFHWRISAILGVWAVASVVCQQFLESRRWSLPARFVWGLLD